MTLIISVLVVLGIVILVVIVWCIFRRTTGRRKQGEYLFALITFYLFDKMPQWTNIISILTYHEEFSSYSNVNKCFHPQRYAPTKVKSKFQSQWNP